MDPDQTVLTGAVWPGSTLFVKKASNDKINDFCWGVCFKG